MSQPYNTPITEELFNAIKYWLRCNTNPEDIYNRKALEEWAQDNGYTKENPHKTLIEIQQNIPR